jgi:hypothetical protein
MLTVPLDCPFLIAHSVFSNIYLSCVLCTQGWQYLWIIHSWSPPRFFLTSTWPVSCAINVDTAYGLSIRFSRTFICPVSCVFNVASVSALFILNCPLGFLYCLFVLCLVYSMLTGPLDCPFLIVTSVFSNIYLSFVLCAQCWQYLWIIHSWSLPPFSLTSTWHVSCVLNVDRTSGLSILDCPIGFL